MQKWTDLTDEPLEIELAEPLRPYRTTALRPLPRPRNRRLPASAQAEIRDAYWHSDETLRSIAKRYGIGTTTVWTIGRDVA